MSHYSDDTIVNLSAEEYALLFKYDNINDMCMTAKGCSPCILYPGNKTEAGINLCPLLNPEYNDALPLLGQSRYLIYPKVFQFFKEREGSFKIKELKSFVRSLFETQLKKVQ